MSEVLAPTLRAATKVRYFPIPNPCPSLLVPPLGGSRQWRSGPFDDLLHDDYLPFWNATVWRRGAVLAVIEREPVQWAQTVADVAEFGGHLSSVYQLTKTSPKAAVRHAEQETRAGPESIAVLLSASNGLNMVMVCLADGFNSEVEEVLRSRSPALAAKGDPPPRWPARSGLVRVVEAKDFGFT